MRLTRRIAALAWMVSILTQAAGCLGDDRCSPGQVLERAKCVVPEPDGGGDKDGATLPAA